MPEKGSPPQPNLGTPDKERVARIPRGHRPSQAHCDGLVAVVGTALLQHIESSWVMGINTLLGEDILGHAIQGQSEEWVPG